MSAETNRTQEVTHQIEPSPTATFSRLMFPRLGFLCLLLPLMASLALNLPARAETPISGNQSGLWDLASSPYVVTSNVTVPNGETLVIQAGVEVRFPSSGFLQVNGTLDVQGTEAEPVLMTSALASPTAGSWQGLLAGWNSFLDLDHLWIRYGGASGLGCLDTGSAIATLIDWNGGGLSDSAAEGIDLAVSQASLRNLLIERCADSGIELNALAPPTLDSIVVNESGLTAVVIEANPGNLPSTITGTGNGNNGVYVTGTLGGSEPAATWAWDPHPSFPIIPHQVTIGSGDTLEILGNCVLKFWTSSSQIYLSGVGTVLRTPGPGPVTFTSLQDDSVGGDTNSDADATAPSPGDWNAVLLNDGASADLTEANFRYGGSGGFGNVGTSSGFMTSLDWNGGGSRNSASSGASFNTGPAEAAELSGLSFESNAGDGLYLNSLVSPVLDQIDASNNGGRAITLAVNPGSIPGTLSGTGNGTNGIYVAGNLGGNGPTQTWTWAANTDFPVVVHQVNVSAGDVLEVEEGSVVKFATGASQIYLTGSGSTLRTPGPGPSVFTSLSDDTVGGDTNNDGSATLPSAGDWNAVLLNDSAGADLTATTFAYGGSGGSGNVGTSSGIMASLDWQGGESRMSASHGAALWASAADLGGLSFSGNAGDGLSLRSVTPPVLNQIDASDNGGRAIAIPINPGNIPGSLSGTGNVTNGIYVAGNLGGNEPAQTWTWAANTGFPVVADQVNVSVGDVLEVAEGSVVKFAAPASQIYLTGAGSTLRTPGPGPCVFTSLNDDSVGGDTNGDGSATSPSPGDWNAVLLNDSASADLAGTTFAYGGSGGVGNVGTSSGIMTSLEWNGGGSRMSDSPGASFFANVVDLADLSFGSNGGDGLHLRSQTPPVLDKIDASDNTGRAIAIALNPGHIPGTLTGTGNGTNGIYVTGNLGGNEPAQIWNWAANPGFPTVVHQVNVTTGSELSVADGAVVKFWDPASYLVLQSSILRAASDGLSGDVPQPVWFTSLRDDSRGGDTNGDGDATIPAPGDWSMVQLDNSSSADLADTWFAYGGASGLGNIGTASGITSSLTWDQGGSRESSSDGLYATVSNLEVTGVRFADNGRDGASVLPLGAPPSLESCDFVGNADHGLRNRGTSPTISALSGWWGDVSGPFDPTDGDPDFNPDGLGQPVSDWVAYRAWATGPNTNVTPDDFALLSPENGSAQEYTEPVEITFTWESTIDADGDAVTYDLEINLDPAFGAGTVVAEYTGLTEPTASHVFTSGGEFVWRAIARDGMGGATVASPGYHTLGLVGDTSSLPGDSGNPGNPGNPGDPNDPAGPNGSNPGGALVFGLDGAAPNPFQTSTTMRLRIDVDQDVVLQVFDASGRLVRTLLRGAMSSGLHVISWDRLDDQRRAVPNGLYFYRLAGESDSAVGRIVAIR